MAKSIMVLGTMSNVGKSLITGGLLRVFTQDGYEAAPFKAQNMALNSYITRDGLEMGRAQVMQAECAMKEPDIRMNPILLKPTSDQGSQVILNGEVLCNMSALDYFPYKKELLPKVIAAYDSLSAENEIMVLEGAGSPAEINLMENDIVNTGLAIKTRTPCLLAADIDRGGVFASIYGTIKLLGEEAALIKGILINKFRGDLEILKPGLKMIEDLTGVPVLGVVPYQYLDIDDEDSLSQRLSEERAVSVIDIGVVQLPRMSNFTDFNVFENYEGVSLRYIRKESDFKEPDLVIIPGTKNTIDDLLWMRQTGIENAVLKHAALGKPVFGICGGFQMLGQVLRDDHGVESGGEMKGLGLLPCETLFLPEKTRTRVKGQFQSVEGIFKDLSGQNFSGYEIHMGTTKKTQSTINNLTEITVGEKGALDGYTKDHIYGTYIHGIFDEENVADTIIKSLCHYKNIPFTKTAGISRQDYKEQQYNKLADLIRLNVDMDKIYCILDQGV